MQLPNKKVGNVLISNQSINFYILFTSSILILYIVYLFYSISIYCLPPLFCLYVYFTSSILPLSFVYFLYSVSRLLFSLGLGYYILYFSFFMKNYPNLKPVISEKRGNVKYLIK